MTSADDVEARVDFAGIQALSSREAGYAVALKCLQVQADAEARDPLLRTAQRVVLHEDAWPWYAGALGEIEVGEMLKALGPEWFARHSVPIGAGTKDVDHLVIGPGGVFAINTKHHRGASIWVGDYVLRVNNANTPHLKIAQSDTRDVARRLANKVGFPVPATSVIAVLNANSIVDRRAPDNRPVSVVDAKRLTAWLVAKPRQLNDTKLALIKLAAEEPETWHIDPRAADTLRVMQRFDRLAAQVATPSAPTRSPRRIRATPRRAPARNTERRRETSGDLLKLWFAVGLVILAIIILRGVANQPCTSPISCVIPPLYLAMKPLLVLIAIAAIGTGAIGTLVWLVRRVSR
jgi:hypothetical protein